MRLLSIIVFTVVLISNTFGQTTPTTQVKTIDDLVALRIPTINNRLSALVTGRSSENDGAGGLFFYDSTDTGTTNLGTIFKPAASSGRWRREYSGTVNLKWFGAAGNGVTDDTAAVSAANTIGAFRVPPGTYLIGSSLTLTNTSYFDELASFSVAAGQTLTVAAPYLASRTYPFVGDGTISFPFSPAASSVTTNLMLNASALSLRAKNSNERMYYDDSGSLYYDGLTFNGLKADGTRIQYAGIVGHIYTNTPASGQLLFGTTGEGLYYTSKLNQNGTWFVDPGSPDISLTTFVTNGAGVNTFGERMSLIERDVLAAYPLALRNLGLVDPADTNQSSGIAFTSLNAQTNEVPIGAIKSFFTLKSGSDYDTKFQFFTYYNESQIPGLLITSNRTDVGTMVSDYLRVNTNAFIGYPTGAALQLLMIQGSNTVSTAGQAPSGIRIINNDATGAGRLTEIVFGGASPASYPFAAISGSLISTASDQQSGDLIISTKNSTAADPLTNRFWVLGSGDVGVNTATPGSVFGVQSDADAAGGGITLKAATGGNAVIADLYSIVDTGVRYGRFALKRSSDGAENTVIDSDPNNESYVVGDFRLTTAGKGFQIKEGSNARMGTATLVGGTIAVSNTSVTANTRIFISRSTAGGTLGHLSTTQIASTSFTVNSDSGADTSTVNWLLIEPSP
jgi:hypothetical protein